MLIYYALRYIASASDNLNAKLTKLISVIQIGWLVSDSLLVDK